MSAAPSKNNRLDFIDSLRGLAATYVVLYHVALIPKPPLELPQWWSKFILMGGTGVELFFIVSAFTLYLSMRQHGREDRSLLNFYIRRVFRIVPLFFFLLFMSILRDSLYSHVNHPISKILLNMSFGFNLVPGESEGIVWASWTLGVEMLFYLIFPLIHRWANSLQKALAFFFVTLVAAGVFADLVTQYAGLEAVIRDSFLHFAFLRYLPVFAFGIVVYFLYEQAERKGRDTGLAKWSPALLGASFFGFAYLLDGKLQFLVEPLYWQGIVFGCLLLGLAFSPLPLLVNRVTKFYGEISYSLYLNHPSLVFFLVPVFRFFYTLPIPKTFRYGASLVLTLALLTLLSYLTYRFIEKPGMRLGKNLIRHFSEVGAKPASKMQPETRASSRMSTANSGSVPTLDVPARTETNHE